MVCTTGSSGVATDSTKPIRPAIVATQRVTLTLFAHGSALIGPLRLQPRTVTEP